MNLQDDLDDVVSAIEGDVSAKLRGETHCSAFIKLLPGNKDLLMGHNTWTRFCFKTGFDSLVILTLVATILCTVYDFHK